MRHTAAMGYIEETAPDTYKPTNFSSALTIPMFGAGYSCMYVATAPNGTPVHTT